MQCQCVQGSGRLEGGVNGKPPMVALKPELMSRFRLIWGLELCACQRLPPILTHNPGPVSLARVGSGQLLYTTCTRSTRRALTTDKACSHGSLSCNTTDNLLNHGYPRALRHEPHRGTTAQLANWLQDPKLPIAEPTPGISGRLGLKAAPFAWTCLVRLWSQAAEALLGLNRRTTPAACSGRRAFPCLVPSPRNRQRPAEAAARPCPAEPAPELWHRA